MTSLATAQFWKCFEQLPKHIQRKAKDSFKLWKTDINHPSLQFKKIHSDKNIYSVRIGFAYRAIGVREQETIIWFWIGSHESYNNLITEV